MTKTITAEMIHEEFNTACDDLLELINKQDNKAALDRVDRLRKLGFVGAAEVAQASDLERSRLIMEVIQKYAVTHPTNKVISGEEVARINKKYGLFLRDASGYQGTIPEKNLREIEVFKPTGFKRVDISTIWSFSILGHGEAKIEAVPEPEVKFMICCPAKDVKLKHNEKIKKGKIVVQDPIVLSEVEHNCYLIVTAWGPEAKEVNEKLN